MAEDEPCGGPERPWVRVVFLGTPDRERLTSSMLSDLRAGLEPSKIAVCRADAPSVSEPLAVLNCAFSEDGLKVTLEVVDRVTNKRVVRDIQLAKLPADGRSLALAVEGEELLRASWAELGLASESRARDDPAPPEAVRAVVQPPVRPRDVGRAVLGGRGSIAHYALDQTQYGGDLFALLPLLGKLSLELGIGARGALAKTTTHGTVNAWMLNGDLGVHLPWLQQGDLELDAQLTSHFSSVQYRAQAAANATSAQARGFAGLARLGVGAIFGATRTVRSFTTLGVGYPWLSYAATDGGQRVTGTSGLELYASTGVGVAF